MQIAPKANTAKPSMPKPQMSKAQAPISNTPKIAFGAEFNAAPPPSVGVYVQPGNHLFEIQRVKPILSIKGGQRKTAIVIEVKVIESDTMVVDSIASAYYDTAFNGFFSDFKGFLAAALNCDPLELDESHANMSLFDSEVHKDGVPAPLAGTLVRCNAWHKVIKSGNFTKMQWIAVPGADGAEG